jgi:hypothetical protein
MRDRRLSVPAWRGLTVARAAALLLLLAAGAAMAGPPSYRVDYRVGFDPDAGEGRVRITVTPDDGRPHRLRFSIDPNRHLGFSGDGEIEPEGAQLVWHPPATGGTLAYRYRIDRRRGGNGFDARITERWALLRIDRLIPPVAVTTQDGSVSRATLRFELPAGWNQAEVAYSFDSERELFPIENAGRRFHRPLGWLLAGDLGIRRERIEEMEVAVAAPRGEAMRRNDILAAINATALEFHTVFGRLPAKLLVVGGGDPLWRGGLSGPNSLYLHADRPLISENGSSTLLHELVHVISGIRGARNDDWIAEGIATYYSIELLRRGGLLTERRAERAHGWMSNRGRAVRRLHARHSSGARTARAVVLFKALDAEIRQATDEERSLDAVVRRLSGRGRISLAMLRKAAEQELGKPSKTLQSALLDP